MNRFLLLTLSLFSCTAAAQPPAQPLIPKRQIQFETSTEEQSMTVIVGIPKLLERRFIAEVKLLVPHHSELIRTSSIKSEHIYPIYERLFESGRDFSWLSSRIPREQVSMPVVEQVQTLNAEAHFVRSLHVRNLDVDGNRMPGGRTGAGEVLVNFGILAPTPERAKELTEAFLGVLDNAVTEPIQQELKAATESLQKELKQSRERLAVKQKERDALQAQLKESEPLEVQAINDLKTQRRLLEVDLAGVKARIEACEAILSRAGLTNARKEQVENVKIAAEIELAGLAARQKTLDAIIDQGRKGLTLASTVKAVNGLENNIRQYEGYVAKNAQRMAQYGPFRLVDGKVVIRPIKWETKGEK